MENGQNHRNGAHAGLDRDRYAARAARIRRRHRTRSVDRPTASGGAFPLTYMRTGPFPGRPTIVVIPGGPGLGTATVYSALRRWAHRHGIDLLMIEHRGVGLSRRDSDGTDLGVDDMRLSLAVQDVAAVLDAEGVQRAVVYGSSYGTYLAQAFAFEHPSRVSSLLLDSAMLTAHDHVDVRAASRARLLDGSEHDTARAAAMLRALVADGAVPRSEADAVARIVYEFSGPGELERLLTLVRRGSGEFAWKHIAALDSVDTGVPRPFLMEFDLVGVIAFRELNYAPEPDGLPFDPGASFADLAERFPPFEAEPYDLPSALTGFAMPVVVLSGERDLRTPRSVAERIAELAPHGCLVPLRGAGHSLLDSNQLAARRVLMLVSTEGPEAVADAAGELEALISRSRALTAGTLVRALLRLSPLIPRRRRPDR